MKMKINNKTIKCEVSETLLDDLIITCNHLYNLKWDMELLTEDDRYIIFCIDTCFMHWIKLKSILDMVYLRGGIEALIKVREYGLS